LLDKHVLEGRICIWLCFFQEFSFEVIFKTKKLNVGPYNISRVESGESVRVVHYHLLDAYLFRIGVILNYIVDIFLFLITDTMPKGYYATQRGIWWSIPQNID
jgi:hypothetical protein